VPLNEADSRSRMAALAGRSAAIMPQEADQASSNVQIAACIPSSYSGNFKSPRSANMILIKIGTFSAYLTVGSRISSINKSAHCRHRNVADMPNSSAYEDQYMLTIFGAGFDNELESGFEREEGFIREEDR
jgi:hypothetical protein